MAGYVHLNSDEVILGSHRPTLRDVQAIADYQRNKRRSRMVKLKHFGCAFVAGMFLTAIAMDAADARGGRGGGGGWGGRASIGSGGNRIGNIGAPPSHPIAGVRPGRPGGPVGPGWGGGYWPGYGLGIGAAAVGAGLAYSDWCDPYYNSSCNGGYTTGYSDSYGVPSDGVEYCARTFRTYDRASQTYIAKGGRRVSCP